MAVTQVRVRDLVHKSALWSTSGVLAGVPQTPLRKLALGSALGPSHQTADGVLVCDRGVSIKSKQIMANNELFWKRGIRIRD